MIPFTSLEFFQKKKEILLYKASDGQHHYMLKCTDMSNEVTCQAFYDEFHALEPLSHPAIPRYNALLSDYTLPGQSGSYLVLCMEDRSAAVSCEISSCSVPDLLTVLLQLTDVLSYLLGHGILYTDLHPSNLIIDAAKEVKQVTLLDYTYCYYYQANPHPSYPLHFSYDLSPDLTGQRLLIQELSFLLQDMLDLVPADEEISSRVYRLLETGKTPPEGLTLADFSIMLREILV
jgi:serine/threonine protein kinase